MCFRKTELDKVSLPEGFTITAHSGAFGTPDNSEEFIKKAVSENCAVLELDVSFRPSSMPVIIHCDCPEEDEGVPLKNAFEIIAQHPQMKINLDLKAFSNLSEIDKMLKDFGLFERAFFTGVCEKTAPIVKANSEVPYFINIETTPSERENPMLAEKAAQRIISAGGIGINSHYDSVSKEIVRAVRAHGLLVSVWTANDARAMKNCLKLSPDNITTRHPDVLKKLIESVFKNADR